MKKSLSIRAMLVALFLAAVVGALVLAVTGWATNQRLINSQRYIINDVMPLQSASRNLMTAMGEFRQRHTDLVTANAATIDQATPPELLASRFDEAIETLRSGQAAVEQRDRLATIDTSYQRLLNSDRLLEQVRREALLLTEKMSGRLVQMETMIKTVMLSAEDIAGRTALSHVRQDRSQRELMQAWREDGMTTLPTQLLDSMFEVQPDIGQLSGNVRMAVALLSDLGRQITLTSDQDALVHLRTNEIAQQVMLARQSLAAIAEAPSTGVEQRVLIEDLDRIIVDVEVLMIGDAESVYLLREQQLEMENRVQEVLSEVAVAMDSMRAQLHDIEVYAVQQADSAAGEAESLANAGRTLLISVTLAVIALLAIFGWRTLVRVLGPLVTMRRQMENISGAAGGENADLSMRLEIQRNDEVGQTAQAFNRMMDTFEGMVAQIRESAEAIASSSRQIAAGNENLSQRTDQQAASLAETASSLEQITATVRQTADYADQARDASLSVDGRARSAGDVATRTTEAMSNIREASGKITSIIKAIDDIAFQTNLLALNASVEAARAGDQGRGFAVVAQEVRMLAGRSAEEAAQIRRLVDDSVAKVSEGEHLVKASSQHLQEIIGSLSSVTRYVTEIADATKEQSTGIEQINQAVSQLDQVTHQNARLVQEASSASQMLDERAGDMHSLVGRFRVSEQAGQRSLALPEAPAGKCHMA